MRLVDRVLQAPEVEFIQGQERTGLPVTGAGAFAADARACQLRYVLDREASRQCADIFCTPGGLPEVDDLIARLPAPRFWLELFAETEERRYAGIAMGRKVGYLVDAADDCRSGRISCFAEDGEGRGRVLGASVVFDFDRPIPRHMPGVERHALRHGTLHDVNELLRHAMLEVDPGFARHARALAKPYGDSISELAEMIWVALPAILSFSALLNSRSALDERRPDLAVLNRARAKRGKPPLLDHVEITMRLAAPDRATGQRAGVAAGRRAPRLHFVRGHTVHRAGAMFWRASHFRGFGEEAPMTTVSVVGSAARRGRRNPARL